LVDIPHDKFIDSKYYNALHSAPFILTDWIDYTDEEKSKDKAKELIGGYLKTYTYKEACQNWWNKITEENRNIIQDMPGFDKDIFKEITGIDNTNSDI
jgi:hypothetical protein